MSTETMFDSENFEHLEKEIKDIIKSRMTIWNIVKQFRSLARCLMLFWYCVIEISKKHDKLVLAYTEMLKAIQAQQVQIDALHGDKE